MWEVCMNEGATVNPWPCRGGDFKLETLPQRLAYSFRCFSANSELEKDGCTALNTHSSSHLEKIKQYQAGQTLICFLKKVSSAHLQCEASLLSEEKGEKLETRAISTKHLSLFATLLVCGRPEA